MSNDSCPLVSATSRQAFLLSDTLTVTQVETLSLLIDDGPKCDGNLPSRLACDTLIRLGLAVRIVMNGEEGWQAATLLGAEAFRVLHCCPDGRVPDTLVEARANRKARIFIHKQMSR